MKSALSETYGTANDKQVARRRPGHFVLGLGWRNSGADKALLSAHWVATSGLDQRSVEIKCWLEGRAVRVQFLSESARKSSLAKTSTEGKSDL